MRFSVELHVLDASISVTDYAFIVLVVHLSSNNWTFSLDAIDLILVWRQYHGRFVSIPDQGTLRSRNHNLRMSVNYAADGLG